jgi:hypothetical protein
VTHAEKIAEWRRLNPEKAKAQTREAARRHRARRRILKEALAAIAERSAGEAA